MFCVDLNSFINYWLAFTFFLLHSMIHMGCAAGECMLSANEVPIVSSVRWIITRDLTLNLLQASQ